MNYSKLITPFTMKPEEYQPTGDYMQGMIELARLAKHNTVNTLTEITGGKHFGFQTKAGLEHDLMLLSKDLHNRYLVSFTPAVEQTSTFHKIEIEVKTLTAQLPEPAMATGALLDEPCRFIVSGIYWRLKVAHYPRPDT